MRHDQAIAVLNQAGWTEDSYSEALQIMQCESEMIPMAMGDYWYGEPYALGLFQIHFSYHDDYDCQDVLSGGFIGYAPYYDCSHNLVFYPFDAVSNATLARLIYERSNSWSMWSCRKVLQK